ncbi:MAG TPA: SseB family protein [Hyphomicrobiaceae bacterium]|jgi:hypothetical protein|nr:SseB family protein [Hyphomicrobiaceae bacterium]
MAESRAAIEARFPENPLEDAIKTAMAKPDNTGALKAFYKALYDAEVLIPLDPKGPDVEVSKPADGEASIDFLSLSMDGVEHAVIFSSASQMHLAFPSGCRFTKVKMSRLVPIWPDAPAVLNPEGFGRVLPASEIRGLPIGPMAAREPLGDQALRQAEDQLDQILSTLFRENADQVLLSPLGIHLFKGGQLMLVGKLGAPLTAMVRCLKERAEMTAGKTNGLLAAVGTDHPLELLRLDIVTGEAATEGALLRRSAGKSGWPKPMLPADFRLAA